MKSVKHTKKYAKMFLNTIGIDAAPKAIEELTVVKALVEQSPEFKSFLLNPAFNDEERKSTLKALGEKLTFSDSTVKFVNYLTEVRAAAAIGKVLEATVALYLERKKRAKATVITPAGIDASYESRLKDSLKRITGKDIELQYATDPSLLGGILIKVGSTMYDGSIRGQLRLLRDELVKE